MTKNFKERVRVEWLTTLVSVVFGLHSASAAAEKKPSAPVRSTGQSQFELAIPRGKITDALHVFSDHTGLNVGWFPNSDEQELMLVGPLKGQYSAEYALTQLLAETGLEFEWLNGRSIYIFSPKQDESTGAHRREPRSSRRPAESGTVIVIASRMNIDAPFPSTTSLNRQAIESYGVSTLAELLTYLPQVPFMRSADSRTTGEQYAELRGLGPGSTLILINSRRVAPSATSFDTGAFDLNTIPLTAVKQIEVFLDSHPISLGSDAIGGIINIVLQDDIPHPVVQLKYGTAHGGADEVGGSFGLGTTRDRFRGTATVDFFHRDFLFGIERELTRNQDFRRFGGSDLRSLEASPPNISSLTGQPLPGLNSPFAAVPRGGDDLFVDDFYETSGQRNLVSSYQFRSIVPRTTKVSGVANAELHLTNNVNLFGELLAVDRHIDFQSGRPTVRAAVIPATNPFNPFGEPVAVNALVEGIGSTSYIADTTLLRGVLGVHTTFGRWMAQAAATWHEEDARRWRENELDPVKVTQALTATDPDIALNFFRDGPPGPPAVIRSLVADRNIQAFESAHVYGHSSAEGPVFDLPTGELRMVVGAEWRREELVTPAPVALDAHRVTSAAFTELQLPIIAPDMNISAAQRLDVSIGVRAEHGDFGTNVGSQYALNWRPLSELTMRLSYRDFYRPPNLYDLRAPRFSAGSVQFPDPRRNYQPSSVMIFGGGNASLVPSSGQSWTARMEFSPSEKLSLSAGYWSTQIQDRITYSTFPFILAHEVLFPDRVLRAPPSARDLELGLPGPILSLDASAGNYGSLKADGLDIAIKSAWDTGLGRFSPRMAATWNHSYTTVVAPGLTPERRVGLASDAGTLPRWRAVASAGLEREKWALFTAIRFFSSYDDAFLGVKNGRSIPSGIQLDVQATMQMDAFTSKLAPLKQTRMTIGAINLLDAEPAYSEVFGGGVDSTQADLRQRFWYFEIAKSF